MNEQILVVDDDALICELFKAMLQRAGFRPRSVLSGRQAFQELEKAPVDLLLLDIMMADSDGITVLRQIRENPSYANLPIIILTALSEPVNKVRALELGAKRVLLKPIDLNVLVDEVTKVLHEAQAQANPVTLKPLSDQIDERVVPPSEPA